MPSSLRSPARELRRPLSFSKCLLGGLLALIVAACERGTAPKGCTIQRMSIVPLSVTLAPGESRQLIVDLVLQEDNCNSSITWASSTNSVATISASGVISAVAPGSATITASFNGTGTFASVTVTPPQLAKLVIAPDTIRLTPTDSQIVNLTATLSTGQPTTVTTVWSSSNPSVVTVDATGLVIANTIGVATVSATSGSVTGAARVEVANAAVGARGRVSGPSTFTVSSTDAEIAAGTIRLVRANPNITFAPGDVLVGTEVGGYLRKIETVQISGNVVTATTTEAELPEAFDAGNINFEEDLDFATAGLSAALRRDEVFGLKGMKGVTLGNDGVIHFANAQLPFDLDFTAGPSAGVVQVKINLTGDLEFLSGKGKTGAPTFKITDKWAKSKRFPWAPELKTFTMAMTAGAKLDAVATAEITGAVPQGGRKSRGEKTVLSRVLTKGYKGFTCSLFGPAPVCYKITASLVLFVEPEGGPKATITQEVHLSAGATAGLTYSGGKLGPSWTPFSSSNVPAPTVTLSGTIGVKFGVEPRLEISFYGAGGPELGLPLGLELEAGLDTPWTWYVDPSFGAEVALGIKAKVFGFGLRGEYSKELFDVSLPGFGGALASLSVTPPNQQLNVGSTRQLSTALAYFSGGNPLASPPGVVWTSSNNTIATVSAVGLVTGTGGGTATITATLPGRTPIIARTNVVILQVGVSAVSLSAPSTTLAAGTTTQLIATPRDAQGNALQGRVVTFTSGIVGVATVSATGLITAVSTGTTAITATCEGRSATVVITVTAAPLTLSGVLPGNGAIDQSIETRVEAAFSQDIDFTTVNSTTFRVTDPSGQVVPGAYAALITCVVGCVTSVVFTPTSRLTETLQYTVAISTGIKSKLGASLNSAYTGTFRVTTFDPNYFYRFFSNLTGQTNSIDTYSNSLNGFMGTTGGFSGQYWYLTPIVANPGFYLLRNQFMGSGFYLDGTDGVNPVQLRAAGATPTTSQMWRLVGNTLGCSWTFQNANFGVARSLENVSGSLIMKPTPSAAQCFSPAREVRR